MKTIAIGTLALLLSLQGCTYFTEPLKQPVIEEKLNPTWLAPAKVGTLSLTPERRVVLVNFHNNRFCAEAPTEVGLDLAGIISATISASQGDQAKLEAGWLQPRPTRDRIESSFPRRRESSFLDAESLPPHG